MKTTKNKKSDILKKELAILEEGVELQESIVNTKMNDIKLIEKYPYGYELTIRMREALKMDQKTLIDLKKCVKDQYLKIGNCED